MTLIEKDFRECVTDWIIDVKQQKERPMVCIKVKNLDDISASVIKTICEDCSVACYIDSITNRIMFYWGSARNSFKRIPNEECEDLFWRLL